MGYRLDTQDLIPGRGNRIFYIPQHPNQLRGPPSLLSNQYCGERGCFFSLGVKWSGFEIDHSPPYSDEITNGRAILPLPIPLVSIQ
jgi:hypothetical protein